MENLDINLVQTSEEVYKNLVEFNNVFDPPLHLRVVDLESYARKLFSKGYVYVISKDNKSLGFIAFYSNDYISKVGYLSQIAVKPKCIDMGVGHELLKLFEKFSFDNGMTKLKLEVNNSNEHAINFYLRNGYKYAEKASDNSTFMVKKIGWR